MILHSSPRARRTLLTVAALLTIAATPQLAWACWYTCTAAYGLEFDANGTTYELTSCTQTYPDGARGPLTVCHYSNVNW